MQIHKELKICISLSVLFDTLLNKIVKLEVRFTINKKFIPSLEDIVLPPFSKTLKAVAEED